MKVDIPANERILEAHGLSVVLGDRKVLDVPSFAVRQNETLVIIGPNGSGKSTLVLSLGLLLKPATGDVLYHGQPVLSKARIFHARRQFAIVFQEPLLLDASVLDNVMLGLKLHGITKTEAKYRAEKWLSRFGIASLAGRQAKTLSGGEAKRASLARAFVLQPEILFLDEPFNALDTPTRQGLLEDFRNVLKETRTTTVMVTHDHNEALALSDRLAVMIGGQIRQIGTFEEVFSTPVDEGVAEFLEAGNILQGTVQAQNNGLASVNVGENRIIYAISDLLPGTGVAMFIPYDDINISVGDIGSELNSSENRIKGKVLKYFPQGSQLKVSLDCGIMLSCLITHHMWENLGLGIGQDAVVSFKSSAPHLIPKT
jgi:tungstate transport system ATP-binding protein